MISRKRHYFSFLTTTLLLVHFASSSNAEEHGISCKNMDLLSGPEESYCYGRMYEEQDQLLNNVYKKIIAVFKKHETGLPDQEKKYAGGKQAEDKLKIAQHAWINYRDKYCDFAVGVNSGVGTGWQVRLKSCLYRITKQRAVELERYYAELSAESKERYPQLWK